MVSLSAALRQVKEDVSGVLLDRPSVEATCERNQHHWRQAGPLGPFRTVELFVRQIVEGNVPGSAVVRLGNGAFSEAAWCQARQRLPLPVLKDLAQQVRQRCRACEDGEFTWHGRHVYLIDAASFSMPDNQQLREHFGDVPGQKPGCGFPLAHWLALFDLETGLLAYDEVSSYTTGDVHHTPDAHAALSKGDIVIGDDAFSGYCHIALLGLRELDGIFPSHHKRIANFTPNRPGGTNAGKGQPKSRWIASLGQDDQLVEIYKPAQKPQWMSSEQFDALPASMVVREIRRTTRRKGFRPRTVVIVTTLLDAEQFPADEIVALRFRRWEVETDIRHLKTTMNMEVLRCQTGPGVLKEVAVFGLVYNVVRAVMLASAARQKVKPTRLSFADALAWLRHAEPDHDWPVLKVVPHRPGRIEPRAVKRRPKPFDLMVRPRDEMRKRSIAKQKGS